MKCVEYNSNNSGGGWWLRDKDWAALERAGWWVAWGGLDFCNSRYSVRGNRRTAPGTCAQCKGHRLYASYKEATAADDRWLGALATSAYRVGLSVDAAIAEWEAVTGQDASAEGCSCCGSPHSFGETDGPDGVA